MFSAPCSMIRSSSSSTSFCRATRSFRSCGTRPTSSRTCRISGRISSRNRCSIRCTAAASNAASRRRFAGISRAVASRRSDERRCLVISTSRSNGSGRRIGRDPSVRIQSIRSSLNTPRSCSTQTFCRSYSSRASSDQTPRTAGCSSGRRAAHQVSTSRSDNCSTGCNRLTSDRSSRSAAA